jgi:hypothetical protein
VTDPNRTRCKVTPGSGLVRIETVRSVDHNTSRRCGVAPRARPAAVRRGSTNSSDAQAASGRLMPGLRGGIDHALQPHLDHHVRELGQARGGCGRGSGCGAASANEDDADGDTLSWRCAAAQCTSLATPVPSHRRRHRYCGLALSPWQSKLSRCDVEEDSVSLGRRKPGRKHAENHGTRATQWFLNRAADSVLVWVGFKPKTCEPEPCTG